jgi:acyl-coenzyme A synthetase/AMP-(fatty) acid ligase
MYSIIHFRSNLGEALRPKQLTKLVNILKLFNVQICTQYGMTECNTALGCQLQNIDDRFVSMGHPLPGYRCLLIDEQGQMIYNTNNTSEIGQIHIGGQAYLFQLLL